MSIGQRVLLGKFGRHLILSFAMAGGTSPLAKDLKDSLLGSGHEVHVFSRSMGISNVLNYKELETRSFDVLVNLIGGHSSTMDDSDVKSILDLSENLVNVAKSRNIPLVHVSSGSVLGTLDSPASNEHPRVSGKFSTRYQEAKVRIEQMHDSYRHLVPIADLRLFSFAGPHFLRDSDYFLSRLCVAAKDKTDFKVAGRGFLRDFTGPHELASAIELAVQNEFSGTANLFSEEPASRSQILDLFADQFELTFQSEEALVDQEIYCASRSFDLSGFSPRSSLEVISSEYVRAFG